MDLQEIAWAFPNLLASSHYLASWRKALGVPCHRRTGEKTAEPESSCFQAWPCHRLSQGPAENWVSVLHISRVELDLVSGLFTALISYDSKWEYAAALAKQQQQESRRSWPCQSSENQTVAPVRITSFWTISRCCVSIEDTALGAVGRRKKSQFDKSGSLRHGKEMHESRQHVLCQRRVLCSIAESRDWGTKGALADSGCRAVVCHVQTTVEGGHGKQSQTSEHELGGKLELGWNVFLFWEVFLRLKVLLLQKIGKLEKYIKKVKITHSLTIHKSLLWSLISFFDHVHFFLKMNFRLHYICLISFFHLML